MAVIIFTPEGSSSSSQCWRKRGNGSISAVEPALVEGVLFVMFVHDSLPRDNLMSSDIVGALHLDLIG